MHMQSISTARESQENIVGGSPPSEIFADRVGATLREELPEALLFDGHGLELLDTPDVEPRALGLDAREGRVDGGGGHPVRRYDAIYAPKKSKLKSFNPARDLC